MLEYSLLETYKTKSIDKLLPLQEVDVWQHSKLRNIFKNSTKKRKYSDLNRRVFFYL
nr:MAG TPA: hypothetical protein [Caudoviricetes sp.]